MHYRLGSQRSELNMGMHRNISTVHTTLCSPGALMPRMNMNEKLTWTFAAVAAASGGAVVLTDRMEAAADPQMKRALACVLMFWWVSFMLHSSFSRDAIIPMHSLTSADCSCMAHAGWYFWCAW